MVNILKAEMSNSRIRVLENLGLVVSDMQIKCDSNSYIDANVILEYLTEVTKNDEDPNVVPERVLNQATVTIEYIDSIPAVNGLPLWERLDCEPLDFYDIFKLYREQKYIGVSKHKPEETGSDEGLVVDARRRYQRSFENLIETTGLTRKALYAISKVYHWQMRANLYDSYRKNFIELENNRMITLMETKHQSAAKKIFEKCVKYFEDIGENELKKLSPKDVLSWWTEASKLERLSRGLPGDKIAIEKRQTVNITKIDNKTLNLNVPKPDNKYLQKLVNVLGKAGALPKEIEAKADVIEAIGKDEVVVIDESTDNRKSE